MIMNSRILGLATFAALTVACSSNPAPAPTPSRNTPARPPGDGPARILLATGYTGTAILERNDSIILALPNGGRQVQVLSLARFAVT